MSCLLRATNLSIADKLRSAGIPVVVRPDGDWNAEVSTADMTDRASQVKDAIQFLSTHRELLLDLPPKACLDFGVAAKDVAAQFEEFPSELLRLAGQLNLDLAISIYAVASEEAT
jgi:hypothetical protein